MHASILLSLGIKIVQVARVGKQGTQCSLMGEILLHEASPATPQLCPRGSPHSLSLLGSFASGQPLRVGLGHKTQDQLFLGYQPPATISCSGRQRGRSESPQPKQMFTWGVSEKLCPFLVAPPPCLHLQPQGSSGQWGRRQEGVICCCDPCPRLLF